MKILGLIFCVLIAFVTIWANSDQDTTDCQFWKQLAHNLSHANEQPGGMMSLACNNTCSQLTCSGHLNQLKLTISLKLEMDFCFGVRLNHCDQPVTMDYYLDVADKNISKSGSVAHNDTFEIPGPNFGTGSGQGTVVVLVEMDRVNTTHILFGIVGKVRIQLSVGGPPLFPYTQNIFPPTYIDVPPCTEAHTTKTPFLGPDKCIPPPPVITPATTKGVTDKPVFINSATYNKSCEYGLDQCSKNEMCNAMNEKARNGLCICDTDSDFDSKTGLCQPKQSMTTIVKPPVTAQPPVTNQPPATAKTSNTSTDKPPVTEAHGGKSTQKAGINMTGVIIGAVFGGLLLIVVVVSVIICIGRRKRQAYYRGRHQLLTDNDDDDDTNVVI